MRRGQRRRGRRTAAQPAAQAAPGPACACDVWHQHPASPEREDEHHCNGYARIVEVLLSHRVGGGQHKDDLAEGEQRVQAEPQVRTSFREGEQLVSRLGLLSRSSQDGSGCGTWA